MPKKKQKRLSREEIMRQRDRALQASAYWQQEHEVLVNIVKQFRDGKADAQTIAEALLDEIQNRISA